MRVAVAIRLETVEAVLPLQMLDDRVGDVPDVPAAEGSEALDDDPAVVERGDHRQPERLAEGVVLGAAARGDVHDPGALVLADVGPRNDAVFVGRIDGDR